MCMSIDNLFSHNLVCQTSAQCGGSITGGSVQMTAIVLPPLDYQDMTISIILKTTKYFYYPNSASTIDT